MYTYMNLLVPSICFHFSLVCRYTAFAGGISVAAQHIFTLSNVVIDYALCSRILMFCRGLSKVPWNRSV